VNSPPATEDLDLGFPPEDMFLQKAIMIFEREKDSFDDFFCELKNNPPGTKLSK